MDLIASKEDFEFVAKEVIIARLEHFESSAEKVSVMVNYCSGDYSFKQQFSVEISEYQDFTIMPGHKDEFYLVYEGDKNTPYFANPELSEKIEKKIKDYFANKVVLSYGKEA